MGLSLYGSLAATNVQQMRAAQFDTLEYDINI
ncbi:hypothetical protein SCAR479_12116 [Seiridium cardinale]|uniref:Uncharacterized protein n=1 Tax=Seiridium cardinale TaxID=138064 RepID=A0ABR2XCC1_9PEZI